MKIVDRKKGVIIKRCKDLSKQGQGCEAPIAILRGRHLRINGFIGLTEIEGEGVAADARCPFCQSYLRMINPQGCLTKDTPAVV